MIAWLRKALLRLERILWPERLFCLTCDERSFGEWLCPFCSTALAAQPYPRSPGLRAGMRHAYPHAGVARELVLRLKYDSLPISARILAKRMAEVASALDLPPDTVVTWAAMPPKRRAARGIDHGMVLCREVSTLLGLPMKPLLRRTKNVRTQRGLSAVQRKTNLRGVFCATEKISFPVLIVDDVCTTGSTIRHCKEALIAAGAQQVYAVTATKAGAIGL